MKFAQKVVDKAVEVNDKTSNRGSRTKPKNPYTANKQTKHVSVKQTMMTSKLALAAKIDGTESISSGKKDNCVTEYNKPNLVSPDKKSRVEKQSTRAVTNNTTTRNSKSRINSSFSCIFLGSS
jgi:hypothetical protein